MNMMERKAKAFGETAFGKMGFGKTGFGETGRHRLMITVSVSQDKDGTRRLYFSAGV